MIKKQVIVDTGPLVAFLNKRDHYHKWAIEQFASYPPPFYSCEPVITETCFLLNNTKDGVGKILKLIDMDLIKIPFMMKNEIEHLQYLTDKYKNVPASLADASLIRMSEQISGSIILTLDSDFRVYRKNKKNVIPVVIPKDR